MEVAWITTEEAPDVEFFMVHLAELLEVGLDYSISMEFSRPLINTPDGVYYTSYVEDGVTELVSFTKHNRLVITYPTILNQIVSRGGLV